MRPNLFGAPRLQYLIFFSSALLRLRLRFGLSSAPVVHVCAAGRGVLGLVADTRKLFFAQTASFLNVSSLVF